MILDKIWIVATEGEWKHILLNSYLPGGLVFDCKKLKYKCSFLNYSSVSGAIKYMSVMSKDAPFKTVKFMNPESEQN